MAVFNSELLNYQRVNPTETMSRVVLRYTKHNGSNFVTALLTVEVLRNLQIHLTSHATQSRHAQPKLVQWMICLPVFIHFRGKTQEPGEESCQLR